VLLLLAQNCIVVVVGLELHCCQRCLGLRVGIGTDLFYLDLVLVFGVFFSITIIVGCQQLFLFVSASAAVSSSASPSAIFPLILVSSVFIFLTCSFSNCTVIMAVLLLFELFVVCCYFCFCFCFRLCFYFFSIVSFNVGCYRVGFRIGHCLRFTAICSVFVGSTNTILLRGTGTFIFFIFCRCFRIFSFIFRYFILLYNEAVALLHCSVFAGSTDTILLRGTRTFVFFYLLPLPPYFFLHLPLFHPSLR